MSKFTDSIDHYLKGINAFSVGACKGCSDCDLEEDATNDEYDIACEGWFSSRQCDSCGSTYGGDRYAAHGLVAFQDADGNRYGEMQHFAVCVDCLFLHANGDEPDEPWYQHPREERAPQPG